MNDEAQQGNGTPNPLPPDNGQPGDNTHGWVTWLKNLIYALATVIVALTVLVGSIKDLREMVSENIFSVDEVPVAPEEVPDDKCPPKDFLCVLKKKGERQ